QKLELGSYYVLSHWIVSLSMVWWKLRQVAKKSERHETLLRKLPEPLPETLPKVLPYDFLLLIAELSNKQTPSASDPNLPSPLEICRTVPRDYRGRTLHRKLVGRPDLLPVIVSYHGPLITPKANDVKAEGIISSGPNKGEALWRKMWTTTRKQAMMPMDDPGPVESAKIILSGAVNIRELHFTGAIVESYAPSLTLSLAEYFKLTNSARLNRSTVLA
ncbi:hypothetical protein M407DRAFT_29573, partial [Tulasnella calospora MUT 4182]